MTLSPPKAWGLLAAALTVALLPAVGVWGTQAAPPPSSAHTPPASDPSPAPAPSPVPPSGLEGLRLVLLGDSLAAGEGAGHYSPGTDEPGRRCHRSGRGLFSGTGAELINLACSRATTGSLVSEQFHASYNNPPEPPQLERLQRTDADAVVLWIGGNDVGFSALFEDCILESADCTDDPAMTAQALGRARNLGDRLRFAYEQAGRRGGPPLIVPAYPQLVGMETECGSLSAGERAFATELVDTLNASIGQAARAVAAGGYPIVHVPQTAQAFASRGACSPDPLVRTVTFPDLFDVTQRPEAGQELLHPTAEGYRSLTALIAGPVVAATSQEVARGR